MNKDVNATFKLKREELADFLKTRRAAVRSRDVGLPENPGRREPGLRREDVAELADLSVSWYSRLEQTRKISVSNDALLIPPLKFVLSFTRIS